MHDIPHEVFTGHECNLRYSQTLKIPSTYKCVYDDKGGIIYASRALLAFQVAILFIIIVFVKMYDCVLALDNRVTVVLGFSL